MLEGAFVLVHALKISPECVAVSHRVVCSQANVQGLLMEFPSNCKRKTLGQLFVLRLFAGVCYQSNSGACFLLWIMDSSCKYICIYKYFVYTKHINVLAVM